MDAMPQESLPRKPAPDLPPAAYADRDLKENIDEQRQPSSAPSQNSARVVGAPMSPVKINMQPEDWPPSPSRGTVYDGDGRVRQVSRESEPHEAAYHHSESTILHTHNLAHRPAYTLGDGDTQKPQAAVISPVESPGSRSPSNIPSINRETRRRGFPDAIDENGGEHEEPPVVPRLQYHHQSHHSEGGYGFQNRRSPAPNDMVDIGASIDRHLTPGSQSAMRTSTQRPISAYSDRRGQSPGNLNGSPIWGNRATSANSWRSNDNRPISYVDLANVSYPQAPPPPISLDNSQLRSAVGTNASLLSSGKTLEMYRQNVKKTSDVEIQYAFAIFLIQTAQETGLTHEGYLANGKVSKADRDPEGPYMERAEASPQELLREAKQLLQKLSDKGYPFAQYYLADGYASGLFSKGKEDYNTAFPLFVSASKHGHAESGYRAALCYEFGWGCRKDPAKAVQFYRQSASKNHPGAMTRLGRACLMNDLGLNKYKEGLKWLNRATESADMQYNAAPYHLGLLYETGYGEDVFQDEEYAAKLFTIAADLGHPEASYRLGDAYEHGKMLCPRDPALSVHFYTGAAQRGHPMAMMALCAWYMVGAEPVLEKDENEAYEWARQAAECGLVKAQYAVGYFTEMGIGTRRDPLEANVWYVKAAEGGDERAKHRLAAIRAAASGGTPMEVVPPRGGGLLSSGKVKKKGGPVTGDAAATGAATGGKADADKDCIVM